MHPSSSSSSSSPSLHRHTRDRYRLAIIALQLLVLGSLWAFIWHVRVVWAPGRRPPIDLHKKTNDDRTLEAWELFAVAMGPMGIHWQRQWIRQRLYYITLHPRQTATVGLLLLVLSGILYATVLHRILFPPRCEGRWLQTDVGYIMGHDGWGHNMNMLCQSKVWEPHVAQAIESYLYHQGQAIDVGAFIGYHTLRLAKRSPRVYALEGRLGKELRRNLQRNNAHQHVQVLDDKIDKDWTFSDEIQQQLLKDDEPVSLIKIDCEGCEWHFLKGARDILTKWHPALVIEIQDDETRSKAKLGGQQMIRPEGTRQEVIQYLQDLGYTVEALKDEDTGESTWDYLALWQEPY